MRHYRETIRQEVLSRVAGIPGQPSAPFDSFQKARAQEQFPVTAVLLGPEQRQNAMKEAEQTSAERVLRISIAVGALSPAALSELEAEVEERLALPFDGDIEVTLDSVEHAEPVKGEYEFFVALFAYDFRYHLVDGIPDRLAS